MTKEELANWFTYHAPSEGQPLAYETIRSAGFHLADTVNDLVPDGPEKDQAIARIREAVMWANAGIACNPVQEDD